MMSRWRSLFTFGALLVAFALLVPGTAMAQVTPDLMAGDLGVDKQRYDSFRVDWEWEQASNSVDDAKDFYLRYQEVAAETTEAFDEAMDFKSMTVALKSSNDDYEVMIEDLKPGKWYRVGVRVRNKDDATDHQNEAAVNGGTEGADAPDDVLNLMLKPGDGMLMAEWDMATDNGSPVTGYEVDYRETGKTTWMDSRSGTSKDTSTMWAISNLENDTEYEARVRAYSYEAKDDDGWSATKKATPMAGAMPDDPTPTPALPIFGAVALGAGLLAAGRARLRRRELRAGRVQRQINR